MGQVVSLVELIPLRGGWKHAGRVVVCLTGCFDLLHPGHIRLLEQARMLGDLLVVGIESDASVRARLSRSAGSSRALLARPATPAGERAEVLASLAAVDYVAEFEGPSLRDFLAFLSPDVVVVTSGNSAIPEIEHVGRKIVRVPAEPGYSTALLIGRILELPA